jgi:predicted esterase
MKTSSAAALLCIAALAGPARAQAPGDTLPRGRVLERVTSTADTSRHYALYLPSRWSPDERWPLLVLIDPGGRALAPIERYRAAAERRGWVLMSGWEVGNGDAAKMERNDVTLDAMLADAQQRLSMDPRRLYFGGFSGMARYSWMVARTLDGNVAGVIGSGAGFPQAPMLWMASLRDARPFAFFATTGSTDFNLDEVSAVDSMLDATAFPHRLARFEGGHQWPPEEVAAQALDWMQLQAVQSGTAPRDTAFVDSMWAAGVARARALEQAGRGADALREYRALLSDFQGLHDVSAAQARVSALGADPAVARDQARRRALAIQYQRYRDAVSAFLNDLTQNPPAAVPRAAATLRLADVHRQEQDSTADRDASHTATRMLNTALIAASDLADGLMQEQRWGAAVAALRVARQIRPDRAFVCYPLARALAQAHDQAAAVEALTCAVDGKAVRRSTLDGDHLLDPIRSDPRFAGIVSRAVTS